MSHPANIAETSLVSVVDVTSDIARFAAMGLLPQLLANHATGSNIVWASNVFVDKGDSRAPADEILVSDITGKNAGVIRTRASKAREAQAALTRAHAEVFTPTWVCKFMVDEADKEWSNDNPNATWRDYVSSRRLEIACGEAPYLVGRYDAADGTPVAVGERVGILDRKLSRIPHYFKRRSWIAWACNALKSTYGYEFQGDNLLIARVNVLVTIEDYAKSAGHWPITPSEYRKFVDIISWNLWQMDGLSDCVPFGDARKANEGECTPMLSDVTKCTVSDDDGQLALFIDNPSNDFACIYDWESDEEILFRDIKRKGCAMRFDYVIGNPPYQEEINGNVRRQPVYDKFMDAAYDVGRVVMLITPARFLFNAGQTLKAWNAKMLEDEHLKVLFYETDAIKVFSNTDIKGGVAITLRNATKRIGPIGLFTAFPELNSIIRKVEQATGNGARLDEIFASQRLYKFSEAFFSEHADDPNAQSFLESGTRNKILSSAMERMPDVFVDKDAPDSDEVRILGRIANRRQWRCIKRRYLKPNEYIDAYKFLVPEANNSGKYGEKLAEPLVGRPGEGTADTFLNAGPFATRTEPENLSRYYKTRFFRALLGARKVTQHCPAPVWHTIPLQDFTSASDIDWAKSISEIDDQLFEKYGLEDDEVAFIKSHVKEMN